MPAIHLIKKSEAGLPAINPVARGSNLYTSGNWSMSMPRAEALLGARIYFHLAQRGPSYFGGTIQKVEPCPEPENRGRVIFTLEADPACKGVKTTKRWSQEMLIVE